MERCTSVSFHISLLGSAVNRHGHVGHQATPRLNPQQGRGALAKWRDVGLLPSNGLLVDRRCPRQRRRDAPIF